MNSMMYPLDRNISKNESKKRSYIYLKYTNKTIEFFIL